LRALATALLTNAVAAALATSAFGLTKDSRGMGEAPGGRFEEPVPFAGRSGPPPGYSYTGPHFDLSVTRRPDLAERGADPAAAPPPEPERPGFFGRMWNGFFGLFGGR
jgi:hypothetical protein